MRRILLLAVALWGVTAGRPVAAQTAASGMEELVAERVRATLYGPRDPDAWTGLADALEGLPGADASFSPAAQARRVAEDVRDGESGTAAGGSRRTGVAPWLRTTAADLREWLRSRDLGAVHDPMVAPWIVAGILLLAGGALRRRREPAASPMKTVTGPVAQGGPEKRAWTVATLAANGVGPAEIARRTGLSQDAVRFLLASRGGLS